MNRKCENCGVFFTPAPIARKSNGQFLPGHANDYQYSCGCTPKGDETIRIDQIDRSGGLTFREIYGLPRGWSWLNGVRSGYRSGQRR